jgi:LPS-assembly lipoprotein
MTVLDESPRGAQPRRLTVGLTALCIKALLVAVLSSASLLSGGCGFQLQGRQPLPTAFKSVFIVAEDPQTDFVQDLRKALLAAGVVLTTKKEAAGATLIIETDEVVERILSVSARNVPREYELAYRVKLSVATAERELMPSEEFVLRRDISFDETILLAKQREQELLRDVLANDLVGLVMRRLSTL